MSHAASLLHRAGAVVVAHDRADLAQRCVATLRPDIPPDRIVVVVNVPELTDGAQLRALRSTAVVVSPARPQGYGANLNLGSRALPQGVDYWLLTNDDVEFPDGSLQSLLETLAADAEIGVVGPGFHDRNARATEAPVSDPSIRAFALYSARLLPLGPLWRAFAQPVRPAEEDLVTNGPEWLSGAAMLVRAAAFRHVEGFDEEFFLYYEETDFCARLRAAGWRLAHRPDVVVTHLGGESTRDRYERAFLQSRRLYYRKRVGRGRLMVLEVLLLASFVVGAIYHTVAAVARPRSARRRVELLKTLWHRRLFLLGPRVRP